MRTELEYEVPMQKFKDIVRDQALMMLLDLPRSIKSLPRLLRGASGEEIRSALAHMETVLTAGESLNELSQVRLQDMRRIFLRAADRTQEAEVAAPPPPAPAQVKAKTKAATKAKPSKKVSRKR